MVKLAIFDMDGTLFDTNDVNYNAYKVALKKYGVSLDYDYYCQYCNGRHYTTFLPELLGEDKEKIEEVHKNKKKIYADFLNKVKVNERLIDILKSLKNEYKIALVTTASRKNTEEILKYTNMERDFDLILTAEDIMNPKPDPEGFLLAMSKFQSNSNETIVFEDSDVGVEAAETAGVQVYKVINFT